MRTAGFWAFLVGCAGLQAQVVSLSPTFATENDTVTVVFDATQGNGDLTGVVPVYAHTGVITNLSTSPTDWRHVQGNWGTAHAKVLMTPLGNNKHQIKYHIRSFYNVPANETVQRLAFVFRNTAGTVVGRAADGSDIFVDLFTGGFAAAILAPDEDFAILEAADSLVIRAESSAEAILTLTENGVQVARDSAVKIVGHTFRANQHAPGLYAVVLQADNGTVSVWDTLNILVRGATPTGPLPSNAREGITYLSSTSVYLQLRAPLKDYVYVVGDFNNWLPNPAYEMTRSTDGQFYFITLNNLNAGEQYRFQYHIDAEGMRVADPYSELILDPWNDPWINPQTFPNLLPYPTGKTNFPVGVLHPGKTPYNWDNSIAYTRPAPDELVVYELLIRDFDQDHTYQSVIDRLDYIDSLGFNAIELMPIMEFEGNESWGYNPMFFCAPDKYYGPGEDLKKLVEECHKRGIAVLLDIALNHAFGQAPMVRMYFDPSAGQYGQPTPDNPWLNPVPKHDFNVGYDFNHESSATRTFASRVFRHWIDEYRIDGYRLDLSKGYTQVNTLGNTPAWGNFDQSRINILEWYYNEMKLSDPEVIVILEHFADNNEEKVLSDKGFLLWGNENHQYNEATMGFPSNLSGVFHAQRGWTKKHLVGYMESHDEERLIFKNLNYGKVTPTYSTRPLDTALQRVALAAHFFFTLPGPKMIWQFGEMGYDYSINHCPDGTIKPECRVANKPIRWDYLNQPNRLALVKTFQGLLELREEKEVFRQGTAVYSLNQYPKRILLTHPEDTVLILGNFDTKELQINPQFPAPGKWFNHWSQDSVEINDVNATLTFQPGEYRMYTRNRWFDVPQDSTPPIDTTAIQPNRTLVYPNPFRSTATFNLYSTGPNSAVVTLFDLRGAVVWQSERVVWNGGNMPMTWNGRNTGGSALKPGVYLYRVTYNNRTDTGKVVYAGE